MLVHGLVTPSSRLSPVSVCPCSLPSPGPSLEDVSPRLGCLGAPHGLLPSSGTGSLAGAHGRMCPPNMKCSPPGNREPEGAPKPKGFLRPFY